MGNSSNISIHFQLQKEAITVKGAKKRGYCCENVNMEQWEPAWFRTCSFNISELLRVFFVHQTDIFAVKLALKF